MWTSHLALLFTIWPQFTPTTSELFQFLAAPTFPQLIRKFTVFCLSRDQFSREMAAVIWRHHTTVTLIHLTVIAST